MFLFSKTNTTFISTALIVSGFYQQPLSAAIPKIGVYNAGSRYITIARKGNRFCYIGYSIPPKRYVVAVGETIGSLSRFGGGLIIDGFKSRGKQVVLTQESDSLLVQFGKEVTGKKISQEYEFFRQLEDYDMSPLKKCLNSQQKIFMAVPGSGYKI
jgi:hypothetical protein